MHANLLEPRRAGDKLLTRCGCLLGACVRADILLFDRFHQAVAFDDIAVAVQTRAHAAVIDYRFGPPFCSPCTVLLLAPIDSPMTALPFASLL